MIYVQYYNTDNLRNITLYKKLGKTKYPNKNESVSIIDRNLLSFPVTKHCFGSLHKLGKKRMWCKWPCHEFWVKLCTKKEWVYRSR